MSGPVSVCIFLVVSAISTERTTLLIGNNNRGVSRDALMVEFTANNDIVYYTGEYL